MRDQCDCQVLTFWDVNHGAGRLGVGWSASIVSRIDIRHVMDCQLTGDTAVSITFSSVLLVQLDIIGRITAVDFRHDFNSRACPGFRPAAIAIAIDRYITIGRLVGVAARRRVVVDHSVIVVPEDELWLLRDLSSVDNGFDTTMWIINQTRYWLKRPALFKCRHAVNLHFW